MQLATHALKSSSANLGAARLAKICEKVEIFTRSGEPSKAPPLVAQIEIEYPTARFALEAER